MAGWSDLQGRAYKRTPAGAAHQKLLQSSRWKRYSRAYLQRHKLCECPHHRGVNPEFPATLVDHVRRPAGDTRLFWTPSNHVGMHRSCHASFKQSAERGGAGFARGCDARGEPLDPSDPWYQER